MSASTQVPPHGNWSLGGSSGNDYIGTHAGVSFDGKHGWLRIRVDGTRWGLDEVTAVDWAYENLPGIAITAGDIPEPGADALTGLALLVLGVAGLRRQREVNCQARQQRSCE
jgi:MYXO-CTERM domain-containing protein